MRSITVDALRYGEALMMLSGLRIVLFAGAPPPPVEPWYATTRTRAFA